VGNDGLLWRVAAMQVALLAVLVIVLRGLDWPVKGTLLGAGVIGFSFVTFWVVARSITHPSRKPLAIVLGTLKIVLYMALTAAVLTGRLLADGAGFALGVSSFVVAVVTVAALRGRALRAETQAES